MTPELKQQWVKALRSGQYAQGKYQLRTPGKPATYCCLGVLQEIAGVVNQSGHLGYAISKNSTANGYYY